MLFMLLVNLLLLLLLFIGYSRSEPSTFIHLFLELCVYSDVDHDNDPTNHKSVSDFCIFLGDYLISCKNKKQSIVFQSSTETEYHAMTSTTR
jgi:hypothetical protein